MGNRQLAISNRVVTLTTAFYMMSPENLHSMYFVALLCPQVLNEKILQYKHWMKEQFGCVVALKSPAHITLVPPFWWATDREDKLLEIVRTFETGIGELEIRLKGFSHFGKRVLFVGVEKNALLENVRNKVVTHFSHSSGKIIPLDDRPFHPHVTIANRDLNGHNFLEAWDHFSKMEFTETFRAKKISLLKLVESKWEVIEEKDWC